MICSTADCAKPPIARGLCAKHYQQWRGKGAVRAAVQFAPELRKAMTARGMTPYAVARACGFGHSTVYGILHGKTPRYVTAVALAEVLAWDSLIRIAVAARERICPIDDKVFITASERNRIYCSHRCRSVATMRRHTGNKAADDRITKHRLTSYQEAIASFCRGCEPFGLCRDAKCELRGVSPLPFVPIHSVTRRAA